MKELKTLNYEILLKRYIFVCKKNKELEEEIRKLKEENTTKSA